MRSHLLVRSAPRVLRAIAALLLLVSVASTLERGIQPGLAGHCAGHPAGDAHGHHAHRHDALGASSASALHGAWMGAVATAGHECTHCPPADCSSRVPCASETSGQSLLSALPAIYEPPALTMARPEADRRAGSAVFQPPTPPPQLLS